MDSTSGVAQDLALCEPGAAAQQEHSRAAGRHPQGRLDQRLEVTAFIQRRGLEPPVEPELETLLPRRDRDLAPLGRPVEHHRVRVVPELGSGDDPLAGQEGSEPQGTGPQRNEASAPRDRPLLQEEAQRRRPRAERRQHHAHRDGRAERAHHRADTSGDGAGDGDGEQPEWVDQPPRRVETKQGEPQGAERGRADGAQRDPGDDRRDQADCRRSLAAGKGEAERGRRSRHGHRARGERPGERGERVPHALPDHQNADCSRAEARDPRETGTCRGAQIEAGLDEQHLVRRADQRRQGKHGKVERRRADVGRRGVTCRRSRRPIRFGSHRRCSRRCRRCTSRTHPVRRSAR